MAVLSSESIKQRNLVSYNHHNHYQFQPQAFDQNITLVINYQICHNFILLIFYIGITYQKRYHMILYQFIHIGTTHQQIIQVNVYLWLPVHDKIFVQHSTQVTNHKIYNHLILLNFLLMFLLYIQVNIQKMYQVLYQSFYHSYIKYCILSVVYLTHFKKPQTKTQTKT